MRRCVLVIILCVVALVLGTSIWVGQQFLRFASGGMTPPTALGTPALPSVMILPSATDGGDSKHLAIGFAQALADRIYCAPTCITQQYDEFETDCLLADHGIELGAPLAGSTVSTAAIYEEENELDPPPSIRFGIESLR